jgi:hypothetical protein
MSAPDLEPYERRAAEAETRLDALEAAMSGGAQALPWRWGAARALACAQLRTVSCAEALCVGACGRVCVCSAGGAMGDAFRVEMIVALRDVRQQLGAARCAQRTLEAQKATVRSHAPAPRVASLVNTCNPQLTAPALRALFCVCARRRRPWRR